MMRLPEWFKWVRLVVWLVMITFFSWLVSRRVANILDGTASNTDIMIVLIWVALLTAFVFQEVDIFGVKLKREIDNVKNDLEKQIISLKSEINQTQTINVYPNPSTGEKLQEIIRNTPAALKEGLGKPVLKQAAIPETEIPKEVSSIFSIRYSIENEMNRLTELYWISQDKTYYPKTVVQKLDFLVKLNVIPRNLASIIREMYAQSSAVIHGEQIPEQAKQWIIHDAASTVQVLKNIPPEVANATKVQRND